MATSDADPDQRNPAVQLGTELRRIRRRHQLSGPRLAELTGFSQSKISRIETGNSPATPSDVVTILRALGQPPEVIESLRTQADQIAGRHVAVDIVSPIGVDTYRLAPRLREVELRAHTLKSFQPTVVHGLLQTSGYAQSIIGQVSQLFGPENLASTLEAVAVRINRQKILADPDRHFSFIMAERVLKYAVNSPATMIEQIDHLNLVTERYPNVSLSFFTEDLVGAQPPLHPVDLYDDVFVAVELLPTNVFFTATEDVRTFRRFIEAYEAVVDTDAAAVLDRNRQRFLKELV